MTVQKEGARYARQYFLDIVTVQIQIYLRKGQQAMLDAGIFSRYFGNIQISRYFGYRGCCDRPDPNLFEEGASDARCWLLPLGPAGQAAA